MRISRLYMPAALTPGATVRLDEEAGHYLRTVLRLKKGYSLTVFNGDGSEYPATVELAGREGVILNLGEAILRDTESPLYTHL